MHAGRGPVNQLMGAEQLQPLPLSTPQLTPACLPFALLPPAPASAATWAAPRARLTCTWARRLCGGASTTRQPATSSSSSSRCAGGAWLAGNSAGAAPLVASVELVVVDDGKGLLGWAAPSLRSRTPSRCAAACRSTAAGRSRLWRRRASRPWQAQPPHERQAELVGSLPLVIPLAANASAPI
jgi:hypothetical protein